MDSTTQISLLERMRDGADALGWQAFFDRYWRPMYAFAKRRGCSDHSAEEVVQEAMLAVFENRHVFRYDRGKGRFRNWLLTVVRQKLALRRRQADRHPAQALAPGSGPAAETDDDWEEVFERALLAALLHVVQNEVTPETYQAFELTTLHGLSAKEAADLTGLTRNAVYLARRRVSRRLRELGTPYAEEGQLDARVKELLELYPPGGTDRSISHRVETSLTAPREALR